MRCRRFFVVAAMAGFLVVGTAGAASAEMPPPGPGFGTHISEMAPEHARAHGAHFGMCVSAMARGMECVHLMN